MKQGHILTTIISILFAVFIVAYLGVQVWRSVYDPVQTVSAVYIQAEDSIELDGFVVREEKIIPSADTGALEMVLSEGERAAKGDVVAAVYASAEALENNRKLQDVDARIAQMNTLLHQGNELLDLDTVDDAIVSHTEAVLAMAETNRFSGLTAELDKLKNKTLSREYIYRDKSGLNEVIASLQEERKQYAAAAGGVKKRITAPSSGYFSHEIDGYETVLNRSGLDELTPSKLAEIMNQHAIGGQNQGTLGKIVEDYAWNYAALVEEAQAERFVPSASVQIKFDNPLYPAVEATVKRVSEAENGKVLVILECTRHISDFTLARRLEARVVLKTYEGLKVPREALRVDENGDRGVYCLIESQVKFKKVEPIFEKDSYYIVYYDSADTKSLLLYDEIVINAKDLENRKVVK